VVKAASLRLEMVGTVGLMERAELSGGGVCMWVRLEREYGVSGVERGEGVVCRVATHFCWLA
jgi:hypothetical protein